MLLAGDISPHTAEATNFTSENPGFNVKTRGLKITHLNIRSLPSKLNELSVRMTIILIPLIY